MSIGRPDVPMTRDELRETIADVICNHARMSPAVQWEIDLLMGAVEQHVALRLNEQADRLDSLPPSGEALQGPYWFRDGIHNAADLLRDEADRIERIARKSSPAEKAQGQPSPTEGDRMT